VLIAVVLCGCSLLPSHIHREEDAVAAKKAQAELTAFADHSGSMYQTMLTNLERFRTEQDRVIGDLAATRERALVNALASFTFKCPARAAGEREEAPCESLEKRATDIEEKAKKLDAELTLRVKAYFKEKAEDLTALNEARGAIAAAKKAVARAKDDADRWSQTVALLKKGISEVPLSSGTQASDDSDQKSKVLAGRLKELGEKEVQFTDVNGKLVTKKIKDVLSDQFETDGEKSLAKVIPHAPGIELTILRLGLDLAEINKKAAEARLAQLVPRMELYEDFYSAIRLVRKLAEDLKFGVVAKEDQIPIQRYLLREAATARAQYAVLSKEAPEKQDARALYTTVGTIAGRLVSIRRLTVADALLVRSETMLDVAEARLAHEESILASRFNDEMWQAVLRSGIDGLVAYHQGGFTREDAANIIRIAQAVALAFIAGGI
jgi:hypothetical protein